MNIRANKIGVVAFFVGLALLDVLAFTIPKYKASHRRAVARMKRLEALDSLRGGYQEMLAAASRDEQQEFSHALGATLNQNTTILVTSIDIGDPEIGQFFSHAVSNCVSRAVRFKGSVHDDHRANPSLALPEPIPSDLQNCLFPEQTASLP